MTSPNVLNAKTSGKTPKNSIYIGRPSKWGNPFSIGKDGDRAEVIAKYIDWLHQNPEFVTQARRELVGHDLVCWCAPLACHGHILRDLAMGGPLPERQAKVPPAQPDLFEM